MLSIEKKISTIVEKPVAALGFELLGIEIEQAEEMIVRIYIDSENGINIDDCVAVHRKVEALLTVDDPILTSYNLEISSPGVDRPLFLPQHYLNYLNQEICIFLHKSINNKYKWTGDIAAVSDESVALIVEKETIVFSFNNIKKANYLYPF